MTATTSQPTGVRKARPIWDLARRLGVQAAMSVTVMAGLHLASVSGYDIRDLLPARAPQAAGPVLPSAEPVGVVGVPARFDIPVEAGSALDHLLPKRSVAAAEAPASGASADAATAAAHPPEAPAPRMAALPSSERVAVPTPRPRTASARPPVAVPPAPSEVPFDVAPRGVEVYDVAELATEEAPPMPMRIDGGGFSVGDLVPSGEAILLRTAEVTGSAAHAVTGTATRLLDLVR